MTPQEKLLSKILLGGYDADIPFAQLWQLLQSLGFNEQINNGHYIFTKKNVEEILNLQHKEGKAKPYQVKQIRAVILKYELGGKKNAPL